MRGFQVQTKCAFTLAETLITLVIVGVIAALTVPTLIAKYQKEQTITRLKKAYSTLAQATDKAIADNGPITSWEMKLRTDGGELFANKYLIPYLSVMKDCGRKTTGECQFSISYLNDNTPTQILNEYRHRFLLNDGTLIATDVGGGNVVTLTVDINGAKKPNMVGKDIFFFRYSPTNTKLFPFGFGDPRNAQISKGAYGCNKKAVLYAGTYCAALIMQDNWRIADDYPW